MAVKKKSATERRSKSKSGIGLKKFVIFLFLVGLGFVVYQFYIKDSDTSQRAKLIDEMPEGFLSFGIDVSHHQGEIDWEHLLVAEHYDTIIRFVYCKATEGCDHTDTRWEENRILLEKLDVLTGAYHFFSPKTPPRPQAAHFLATLKGSQLELPPVLDVESEGFSDKDLIAKMTIWLEEVEKQTGRRPIIYTSLHFFETKFMNEFKNYKFWIAAYSRKPACIDDDRIIHWQYSESGELPGIDEAVDFNVSKAEL